MGPKVLVISVCVVRPSGNPDHDTLSDEEYLDTMEARVRDAITSDEFTPSHELRAFYVNVSNKE